MNKLLLSKWQYRALVVSVVVSMAGYLGFSLWGGLNDVVMAVQRVGWFGVKLMLVLSLANYLLRFLRWQQYLNVLGHSVPWLPSGQIYLAGFAMTTTPGKAGEALRSVLLRQWKVPYTHSLAAFVSERLSDLVAIVLLALYGLSLYPKMGGVVAVGGVCILGGLLLLSRSAPARWLASWGKQSPNRFRYLASHLAGLLDQARSCHIPRLLIIATLLSTVAWLAEALAFYLMLGWLGLDIPLAFAVFVYSVAMLAGALSFLPGGLGSAEAVMVGLLLWKGVSLPEAVTATVLIRFTTLWFAVALGVVALALHKQQDKEA